MESESRAHSQRSASCGVNPLSPIVFRSSPSSARRSYSCSRTLAPMPSTTSGGKMDCGSPATEMITVPPASPRAVRSPGPPHDAAARESRKRMERMGGLLMGEGRDGKEAAGEEALRAEPSPAPGPAVVKIASAKDARRLFERGAVLQQRRIRVFQRAHRGEQGVRYLQ